MKVLLLVTLVLMFSACTYVGNVNGKTYPNYGLANEESRKDSTLVYELSPVNVIVGIIFCETVVIPIYIVGWDLFTPVKVR